VTQAMTLSRPSPRSSFMIVAVVAATTLLVPTSNAVAQFGGYGAMRGWQMKAAQQQMQFMQKQMQAMQEQQKEQYDAFMKRFDTNKNGKIDGKEKGPAQKYLRKLELGVDPDKAIKTLGRQSSSSSSKRAKATAEK
jgi:hypothetical protein